VSNTEFEGGDDGHGHDKGTCTRNPTAIATSKTALPGRKFCSKNQIQKFREEERACSRGSYEYGRNALYFFEKATVFPALVFVLVFEVERTALSWLGCV
jgi:hypothetical protein